MVKINTWLGSMLLSCLIITSICPIMVQADYRIVRDVLSTSGGEIESARYVLNYSTGQTAVGMSFGTNLIETGGFWTWMPLGPYTAVEDESGEPRPSRYVLHQNYPNPFNPLTNISYQLPVSGNVSLKVFNVSGQTVRSLIDSEQALGHYTVTWDGTDQEGNPVASGIYFYQLTCGQFREVRKMLLVK